MPTFFHGWRRKAGCVTLVMAWVFARMWERSPYSDDSITLTPGARGFE